MQEVLDFLENKNRKRSAPESAAAATVGKSLKTKRQPEIADDPEFPPNGYFLQRMKSKGKITFLLSHPDLDETVDLEPGLAWQVQDEDGVSFLFEDDEDGMNNSRCDEIFMEQYSEQSQTRVAQDIRGMKPPKTPKTGTLDQMHTHTTFCVMPRVVNQ